jgi:hypothetical protein
MAITQNNYTGNGSTVLFSFTFPYLETTDIKVSVNGTVTTAYTLANATTIQFNTAPVNGAAIRIYRQTDDSATAATFYPGSAIRSQDLNDNFTQNLYVTQEVNNNAVDIDGSNPMVGDLNMGGYKITNLATPVAGTDAANRSFVEGVFSSEVPVFYRRWSKTAAGGATSLSGNDDNGIALSYVPGSEKVFINGALQVRGVDYSGTTGSTLTGIPALIAGDIVEVHSSSSYTVGTVPDGSITNAKVDGGAAIQSTKLAFGSGATTRTVAAKLADVVSVKDFGAIGDGTTNDTAAVQTAINSGAKVINLSNATYRIVSTLILSSADQTIVGGTLKFDGDNTQRIANITANNIAFMQVIFSGNNKQPRSALVWVNDNCVNPQFIDCEFKNITGINHGASFLDGTYGLLISPYGVTGFSVANCKFKDIVKYNDGVNTLPVVAATEGIGFVGGICFLPENLNPGATAQTVITEGFVSNCTFDNIRTILAAGLSLNDQATYDDGDAIRTYSDTNTPSLNVTVSDCTFKSISKRVFKFRAKGSSAFDNTCYASGMPYAMVVAIDCVSGITIKGFNFYTSTAKPVGSGIQWKNYSADATPVLLEDVYFSHVNTAVEFFSGHASTLQNFTLRNSVFDYVAVAAVLSTSPIATDYANIVFDACKFTGGTNAANGLTFFGGSSSGNAGVEVSGCILTNLNVNCAGNNVRFSNNKVIIKSSSWTGAAPSTKLVRFGGAGSSNYDIDNLTIDASGLSTSYIGVNKEALFLQGSGFRFKNISLVVPQASTQSYPHININSTNTLIDGLVYDGPGF